jgi:hypothetical protein
MCIESVLVSEISYQFRAERDLLDDVVLGFMVYMLSL